MHMRENVDGSLMKIYLNIVQDFEQVNDTIFKKLVF